MIVPRNCRPMKVKEIPEINKFTHMTAAIYQAFTRDWLEQNVPGMVCSFAITAIQEAADAYLIGVFKDVNLCTILDKHITIMSKYISLAFTSEENTACTMIEDNPDCLSTIPDVLNRTDYQMLQKEILPANSYVLVMS